MHRPCERIGWPTIAGLGLVVIAIMVLSLVVTATGTARFAVSMGYDAGVGYAVGAVFDVAKGMLLVGVVALWGRGARGVSAVFAIAWICLVTFSWLATHATVSTAITSIEHTGTWKMEVRGNARAELTSIEQQLAMLSRPTPPRPVKTVAEALASSSVPSGVWKNSQECAAIQDGAYFAKPCADTRGDRSKAACNTPSNVVSMLPPSPSRTVGKGASPTLQGKDGSGLAVVGSHVPAFVRDRLRHAHGASITAGDLRATYEDWCAGHGHTALSQPRLAAELKALGYTKWKSSGLIRYRDLQLVA
jgi:hypothetical protein